MWPGLESMFTFYMTYLNGYDIAWGLWDIREEAYHMAMISYCAIFDPNQTYRSNCKSALSTTMNRLWNVTQSPDGSWQQLYTSANSWTGGTTTVSLTHGSTQVIGNGRPGLPANSRPTCTSSSCPGAAHQPISTRRSRRTIRRNRGCHAFDSGPALRGTTGTHGWIMGYNSSAPALATGWGGQPFISGILGLGFEFTAKALGDTDPANAALAHDYNLSIARWEVDHGYRQAVKACSTSPDRWSACRQFRRARRGARGTTMPRKREP